MNNDHIPIQGENGIFWNSFKKIYSIFNISRVANKYCMKL